MGEQHQAADPSTTGNEFARRLSAAIAARNLSLERLRAHLAQHGVEVSTATLSYWSTGRSRPTRTKSMAVVDFLETVLQVDSGHLSEALPHGAVHPPGSSLGRVETVREACERHHIVRNPGRQTLVVHQTAFIGEDRAQKGFEQWELSTASTEGPQEWAVAVQHLPGRIDCEQTHGCELARQLHLDDDLHVLVFRLARPLASGELVSTSYRVGCRENGDPEHSVGLGCARPLEKLVLEAVFDGEAPRALRRTFTPVGSTEPVVVDRPLYHCGNRVQLTVANASPGLHSIAWDWD